MKKTLLIITLVFFAFHSQAKIVANADTLIRDTVKINKQIKKLNEMLIALKAELNETQNNIPIDEAKVQSELAKAHKEQVKSKEKSKGAVGGDLSEVKKAEKQAIKASKQTQSVQDAAENIEHDRKQVKELIDVIEKTQKKLDKLKEGSTK